MHRISGCRIRCSSSVKSAKSPSLRVGEKRLAQRALRSRANPDEQPTRTRKALATQIT